MPKRGLAEAWAAYRGDWFPVLDFLREHNFIEKRTMINYAAELSRLPTPERLPSNRLIEPLKQEDLPQLIALEPRLFADVDGKDLERFYWNNPFYDFPESLFALKDRATGKVLGAFLLVVSERFADPTKIDAAMPCFRLGAFGTERERHKRVSGLFSCVFADRGRGRSVALLGARVAGRAITTVTSRGPSSVRRSLTVRLVRSVLSTPWVVSDPVTALDELIDVSALPSAPILHQVPCVITMFKESLTICGTSGISRRRGEGCHASNSGKSDTRL